MNKNNLLLACLLITLSAPSGNPIFPGWYADPETAVYDNTYWVYPTYSAPYKDQVFFDAFSSPDLVHWDKHPRILDTTAIHWAKKAMWAPAIAKKDGKYYFFFGANDIQNDSSTGGIGIAVADQPGGPYHDYLGRPLIDKFYNGAQPIDQAVFRTMTAPGILSMAAGGTAISPGLSRISLASCPLKTERCSKRSPRTNMSKAPT